ncbi:MAG: hypothetical protein L0Y79_00265 [Chlorobi bacterium]|nr:hypothetical protein [Chlorobiota bacterium]MCI0716938.1 hypothetical protein [Chlorobiota bacterium]
MKKNNYIFLLISVICLSNLFIACSDDGEQPEGGGSSSNPRIEIDNVNPRFLNVTDESFDVTIKLYDVDPPQTVHLEIRKHDSPTCDAFSESFTAGSSYSRLVYTDSLQSICLSPNSIFRITVWFDDNGTIHRDSVYYQWGTPPPVFITSTVNVETWRMTYVGDTLADTISRSIIRSFNPSDSNYVKVPISFDPLRVIENDTEFVAADLDDLGGQLDDYSRVYDSSTSNKKIFFARSSTLLGVLGLSHHNDVNYKNWSFVFKKNIDTLFAILYNDTSIANYVGVHEMLHQLGWIPNEEHNKHLGYFSTKCAMLGGDQLQNNFYNEIRTYTPQYRVCTYHAMKLRTKLGFIPEVEL